MKGIPKETKTELLTKQQQLLITLSKWLYLKQLVDSFRPITNFKGKNWLFGNNGGKIILDNLLYNVELLTTELENYNALILEEIDPAISIGFDRPGAANKNFKKYYRFIDNVKDANTALGYISDSIKEIEQSQKNFRSEKLEIDAAHQRIINALQSDKLEIKPGAAQNLSMLPQIDEAASITPQPIDYLTGPQLQEIWLRENWIMKALVFPPISPVPYDIHGCQKLLDEKIKLMRVKQLKGVARYQVFAKAMSTAIYKVMAHFKSQHTENLMQIISPDQSTQLIGSIELSHTKSNQLAILIHVQQIISYFASQDVALPADWQKLTADDITSLDQIADEIAKLKPSYALKGMKPLKKNRKKACLSFLENYLLPQAESAFNTEQKSYQKAHQLAMEVLTGRSQAEERLKQTKRLEQKIITKERQLKQLQRTHERALLEKARHINQEIIKDKHQLKKQQQALAEVRKTNGSALAAFNERVKQAQMQLATCYQALKHGLPDIEQTDDAFILTSLPVNQMPLYQAAQIIVDGPAVTLDERYPLLAESTPWQDDLHRLLYQNILKGYHDIYSSWLSRHLGFVGPWCLGTTERTIITNRPSYDKIYRLLNLLYQESSSIKDLAEYLLINKLLMEVAEPFLNFYEMDELVPAASYQSMEVECISDTAAASAEGAKRRQLTLSHQAVERSTLLKQNLQLLLQYHDEHINPLAEARSSIDSLEKRLKEKDEIINEKEEVIKGQDDIIKELTEQLKDMQDKVAKQAHSPARTSKGKTANSIGRFFNEAPSPQEKRPPSPDSGPQAF